jgi:hypothetical protein
VARRPGVRIRKKIGLEDAFRAMYCLARYGIVERP